MPIEQMIRKSDWWRRAQTSVLDASGATVADRLAARRRGIHRLLCSAVDHEWVQQFRLALDVMGFDRRELDEVLAAVALLSGVDAAILNRDAPRDDRADSLRAARELLPEHHSARERILALLEVQRVPDRWHRRFVSEGSVPDHRSWGELLTALRSWGGGGGLVPLVTTVLTRVCSENGMLRAIWFAKLANAELMRCRRQWLPVPHPEALSMLMATGPERLIGDWEIARDGVRPPEIERRSTRSECHE